MGHPGVALRDLEASRDALSRGRYQPQPTERRLSCSHRVTFLTGANRGFPNWGRQQDQIGERVSGKLRALRSLRNAGAARTPGAMKPSESNLPISMQSFR